MKWLDVPAFVVIAARVLRADPADVLRAIDLDVATTALRESECDAPAAEAAARLLRSLLRDPPLGERSAEIAVTATLQFLSLNGWELTIDQPEALRSLVRGVTADEIGERAVASWLGTRMTPMKRITPRRETGMRKRGSRLSGDLTAHQTDDLRRAVERAGEAARELRHTYMGTEHLLLGLLRADDSDAARVLTRMGVDTGAVRDNVLAIVGQGAEPAGDGDPLPTPRARKVLDLSLREAARLGHDQVDTTHMLLGLVREGAGLAAQVLVKLGVDLHDLSEAAMRTLFDDYERLQEENARLRDLLRRHGIDPDTDAGTGRTA